MSSEEKQARARAVYEHLKDSPEFPDPTLDLEVFKEATDSHAAALVEVLDGSRSAFAEKNRSETVLGEMLRTLARYVESKCVGNIQRALASGFDVVSNDKRNRATPVSEKIRKIWVGDNSGQAWVRLVADPEAYAYQLRWRPEEDLADDAWTSLPVANTRPATLINDLIRGKTYVFEVRAVLHLGYTDWSGRVTWTAV